MHLSTLGFAALIHVVYGHPEYLDYIPNGHNSYFSKLSGDGAIGHMGDESGARLNGFGKAYCGHGSGVGDCDSVRREVKRMHSCYAEDVARAMVNQDDDDDDDDHHHGKGAWTVKFCCNDVSRLPFSLLRPPFRLFFANVPFRLCRIVSCSRCHCC